MFDNYVHHNYRKLTEYEADKATKAIEWLASKRLNAERIALLTDRYLDREAKVLYIKIETKHLVWYRKIRYKGTALDLYLTEVLPYLKIQRWLFPGTAWGGRSPSFGFHIQAESVQRYLENRSKMVLIKKLECGSIEVSTKKTHIQNQQLVGRRLALRT